MTDAAPLTPHARQTGPLKPGIPLADIDGNTWHFPYAILTRALDTLRDRIYEHTTHRGRVACADVVLGAWILLRSQYHLTEPELRQLIASFDAGPLMDTVIACLQGDFDQAKSFSNWIRSGLEANGLKPANIHPDDLPLVVHQLVQTKRMMPLADYSDVELHRAKVADLLSAG